MSDYNNDASEKLTMLAGGKVLFDETVGLQPVSLVEVPTKGGRKPASHDRAR
jgi:hypothetical protein